MVISGLRLLVGRWRCMCLFVLCRGLTLVVILCVVAVLRCGCRLRLIVGLLRGLVLR